MPQENVDGYHRLAAAFQNSDLDAFLELFDADVEWAPRIAAMESGNAYRGHEGIRRWWASMFSAYPDYVGEVEEVRDFGTITVARARLSGHGKGSGVPVEQTHWHVVEWREGLIVRMRTFPSEAEALEAAGLSE